MSKFEMKITPLSQGLNNGEVVMCKVTNKSYLFINNELNLIKPLEDKLKQIPQWLLEDIVSLRLSDVRLSCAIYELYNHYAETRRPELSLDENSEWLTLANERLDWIDRNADLIDVAIVNTWSYEG